MYIRSLSLLLFLLAGCHSKPTLFQKIDPDNSGIHFANNLTPSDSLNAFTFTNFYNGGGVGIGDFNHDGRPDLFFTGNQVSCKLYLNETIEEPGKPAQLRFADITQSAGVQTDRWCTGVSVADVNADGWDDIYVCVAEHRTMKKTRNLLFINQKTRSPTFREEAAQYGLDFAGFSTQAVFFDYDRDNDLDCFLLNTAPDLQNPNYLRPAINDGSYPSTGKLFRNRSEQLLTPHSSLLTPIFKDVSKEAGIRFEGLGLGVVASDLNSDGWLDLYCSNDFISSDVLYLNNRDGTFSNTIKTSTAHTSLFGMGIDAGDVDNDGRPDLFQLDMLPEDNERLKQMLAGPDFDKKEQSLKPQYGYQLQYMRNTLQLNTGNRVTGEPGFSEVGLLAGIAQTDWSWSTLLADLDLDGHRDVFITNGYRKNVTDRDFINFTEEFALFGTDEARQRQRDKVLAKVPEIELHNYAYRNLSGLRFQDLSAAWGLDELSYANGAAYADLDRDGDLDLVVNNIDAEASLFQNNSRQQGQNRFLGMEFSGPPGNARGIGSTLTVWAKGQQQLYENQPIRGYLSSVEAGILLGVGPIQRADSIRVTWPDGRTETRRNVATNQRLTFRIADAKSTQEVPSKAAPPLFRAEPDPFGFTHTESDFVDFKITPALHKMLSRGGAAIGVGDLNGDGLSDVVVGPSYRGSAGRLFFGQVGSGFGQRKWLPNTPMEAGDVLLFDADNDRDLDMLLVGGGNERPLSVVEAYKPVLYRNNGRGNLTPTPSALPALALSSAAARAFDYDRDGDQDLLLTGRQIPGKYPLPASSYLLRNDNGQFTDVTRTVAPALTNLGMVCDALPIDIDKDNDFDLVIVGEWMTPTLLRNDQTHFTNYSINQATKKPSNQFANSPGWWNCVAAGDFDHDGDLDLMLGNEGLNTLYRASPEQPVRMVAKDFNRDGLFDPIMGYFIGDQCYPALPRESLNGQLIQFRRKYKRYADYAAVTFDQLFSPDEQKGAHTAEVTQLQSCYAENIGNAQFRLSTLPLLAQQSPIFGFLVRDFDHDGYLDALATGNFHPNEVNMGRQDASQGVFLRGNGKGKFTAVEPGRSGFRAAGDTRKSHWIQPGNRIVTTTSGGNLIVHSWLGRK